MNYKDRVVVFTYHFSYRSKLNHISTNFQKFTLKEGIKLRTRIEFIVQREIVTGLKYIQKTKRLAMSGKYILYMLISDQVFFQRIHPRYDRQITHFISDTLTHMVGSYPPKETPHSFTTPEEDIPHGTLARGTYTVHSLFTDDDKNEHLKV